MKANFADWSRVTPEAVGETLPKLLAAAESSVAALEASSPNDYDSLIPPLGDATRELWRTWGIVSHMLGVMNGEAWRRLEEAWQPRLVAFSLRVSQSRALYEASCRVRDSLGEATDAATRTRRRIVEKMVQAAEHAGVGLTGPVRARFNEIQSRLAKLASDFHNAVLDATAAFTYTKDGRTYTIDDAAYVETMKTCTDRDVRERLCRARATRAPANEARIAEILDLRREMAAILGFSDYAALSLSAKCAPSVEAVFAMIDQLDRATAARAEEEDRELAALSEAPDGVRPWDRAFLAERLRERKYAYSEDELKRHFELEDVLRGLFSVVRFLFGIEVAELRGDDRPSVWHPDVRVFAVSEKGRILAHFYFDPFVRTGLKGGGAWMNEFQNLSVRRGELPLAVVVTNFPLRDGDGRCLLPFREVETLFHEFGHALQCMLTRVAEEEAAGISLVEWDAVEVASQFLENWCLADQTGIVVPDDLKAKVRAAKNFRAASQCRRQLAFARTDLLLHGAAHTPDADALKREVFTHFGVPTVEGDLFLCAFTHIFAGGYAAGYYGYKWAEVMSADCYGAFEEAGLADEAKLKETGAKYRETVLALGGSVSALDVFRAFRGRDPEIAALLRQQGLA